MSSCSIKWCGKNSKSSNYNTDRITFHRFPRNPEVKEAWIKATMRENWFPKTFSVICSRHFTSDCFDKLKTRRRLFSSAVPTLLLPKLGSSEDKAATDDEEPSENVHESNNDDGNDENDTPILKTNEILLRSTDSISKKALFRKNADLTMKLRKTRLIIKRLRDSNTHLKKRVSTFIGLIEKLKNKELLSQDNIDISRLQNSNKQLRKKVVWLKKLLFEQKKKHQAAQQNVVWCPAADDTLAIGKID